MSGFELSGNVLRSRGSKVGELDGSRFRDSRGSVIGSIDGVHIRDASSRKIGSLDGDKIRDGNGKAIASLSDAKKNIKNAIGGVSLAGFYLLFVH